MSRFARGSVAGAAMLATAFSLTSAAGALAADFEGVLSKIKLPPGFKISVFAELPKPRSITICKPLNTIYIGSRHGTIHSLRDTNQDGVADEVLERTSGLNVPNGVACQDAQLYVGLQDRIVKWPVPAEFDTALPLEPLLDVKTDLPNEFLHGWRYIKFGPDRKLYVSIGSPCNICDIDGLKGTIFRMDPDGSNVETVARGVRNSVGFDWHPQTGVLHFTDNGADGMGDDIPPDELNAVTTEGAHFGFPYMGGKGVRLTGYEEKDPPEALTEPVIEFGAHTANLGITFYSGDQFPAEYKNDAFVAQHGSWNRTVPDGYRLMRIKFDADGNAVDKEVFAEGWLSDGSAIGRPVDIAQLPDGSLIVTDDFANVVYRISYGE